MVLLDFVVFLITLFVPGYLLIEKHFNGLEKWVLSVFLSLSVTSFFYYFVVSFFGITKELIYFYVLILLLFLFLFKRQSVILILQSLKNFRLSSTKIDKQKLPKLFTLFIVVIFLILFAFFIPVNKTLASDDLSYHLPIIQDIGNNGQKTFFVETHNIYQVRSNQFPLLFESFAGVTKFFLAGDFFWLISFFALFLSLFLIYFISKEAGHNQFFSSILYALSPFVVIFSRYFYTDTFLSLFFLGCVFFVLKYVRSQNLFFVVVAGFLAGLMFLVKFTGGVFFVGLLLFLLYKRKFKASVLFGLIFVLISLVFVVSHLTVPLEQVSVGSYGAISKNISTAVFLNIFEILEILLWYFSNYFYIIPILFFVGLFWIKSNENDFLVLLLINLFFFLFITFISQASPTSTGFPRYFLPIYSLVCIFAGFQLSKIFLLKSKLVKIFLEMAFVVFVLFIALHILSYLTIEPNLSPRNYYVITEALGQTSDSNIWFVNSGAVLVLDYATFYDYSWKADFSGEPCEFLKKHRINYVIFRNIDENQTSEYLSEFDLKLKEKMLSEECANLFLEKEDGFSKTTVFKIK